MERLVLLGIDGIVEAERFDVDWGQTVVVGRSRTCEVSLRRCRRFQEMSAKERDSDKGLLTVSRRHARISFPDRDTVCIEDLSANGTFVDGDRITTKHLSDVRDKSHELRLGKRELFKLQVDIGETSVLRPPLSPPPATPPDK